MKRKALFNPLVGLTIVIVLFSSFLVIPHAWVLGAQPPGLVPRAPSSVKQAAAAPARGVNPLGLADQRQVLASFTSPAASYPTCPDAQFEIGTLPFTDSGTTVGTGDDYWLGNAGTCAGGGTQYPLTGLGEDAVYLIATDRICTLDVSVTPTGSDDLSLYVERGHCDDVDGNCVYVDDAGGAGVQEDVLFQATPGTLYYVIVDGYNGASGPYDLTISETTSTGCRLVLPYWVDLGDAPDSSNHAFVSMTAYPSGVTARFPTVFDAATGSPPGPMHWSPRGDAWLGSSVSLEIEADFPGDEDGRPNIDLAAGRADQDGDDDGLVFPVDLLDCQLTVITYTVTVAPGASTVPRYVNLWVDYNRDGDWEDTLDCQGLSSMEWAVQDHVFNLGAGMHTLTTSWALPYNKTPEKPVWVRITLSEQPAPSPGDGRGPSDGYIYGETEDYYLCLFGGSYYPCNTVYLPLVIRH